jgi:hypothetical protein
VTVETPEAEQRVVDIAKKGHSEKQMVAALKARGLRRTAEIRRTFGLARLE